MKEVSILFIFSVILSLFTGEVNAASPRLKKHPKHVVLTAFDGSSAVVIHNHPMPNFNRLMEEGAYTLNNRSILPSSGAPNWVSILSGAEPELHGYTAWGSRAPEILPFITNQYGRFPGLYGLTRNTYPKVEVGYICEWDGVRHPVGSLAINYFVHAS